MVYIYLLEARWSAHILTEDQCRQCSTTWFILLKDIEQSHITRYTMISWTNLQYPHSVGRSSFRIASRIDSLLSSITYVSFISAGLRLIISRPDRWTRPSLGLPLPLSCFRPLIGSRTFWVQANTPTPVGHNIAKFSEVLYNLYCTLVCRIQSSVDFEI